MTLTHHPDPEMLMDYAAGSMREPMALLVATHLALCADCRESVRELEVVGGELLEQVAPAELADDAFDRLQAAIDRPCAWAPEAAPRSGDPRLPGPLADYVGGASLEDLDWRRLGRGIAEVRLADGFPGFRTRLLRIQPGTAVPWHTHGGEEATMVLAGGYSDDAGHFGPGDVEVATPETNHQPVADRDAVCYCLAVTTAPLILTGALGRLLNRFVDL
jgi:putative transcriptional regulator